MTTKPSVRRRNRFGGGNGNGGSRRYQCLDGGNQRATERAKLQGQRPRADHYAPRYDRKQLMTFSEYRTECLTNAAGCAKEAERQRILCRDFTGTFMLMSVEISSGSYFVAGWRHHCLIVLAIFCFVYGLHAYREGILRPQRWLKLRQDYYDLFAVKIMDRMKRRRI